MVSLFALFKNLYTVVAASLLGSILSNLLLVLGCSFFLGGLFHSVQTFNAVSNRACSSLLMLACIGICIPSAASMILVEDPTLREDWTLDVSRGTAVVMLVCYMCYLVFQLKTHTELFKGDDDDAVPMLTLGTSIGLLTAITAVVAVCSEFLTGSIEKVSERTHLSQAFIGLIILPIAGNACEHLTACIVAMRNKMDLSMGVAVGSSIQIALFAIPFNVVVGWATGHPFSLAFSPFAALVLLVCVVHANFVTADATSHWLLGVQLIALYCLYMFERLSQRAAKDPDRYARLFTIVTDEVVDNTHNGGSSCTKGLLWLKRAMQFICAILRRLHDDPTAQLSTIVAETYSQTLMQYHGFFTSSAFSLAFKFVPSREQFMSKVGEGPDVMSELKAFVDGFSEILAEIHKFLDEQGLDDPTKV
ncbi:Ca2+/H+ antiporter, cation antiporter, membrane protein [Volvox carteri f. nagariensis]|uniref:Vacuolar cation/proton exchanger n=1 Tax=Volvox carteri f. nagariensis TaxID=3068 RepID=D8UHG6_VOLCA|nr:Ca2+/H+ antiporter, cation antiporter, membrane protein [Volvox carteri f. nagariensis]EFJ40822.1 Ca2+/H+ antiporter, cation antiporter, membrane protein [Volvox carteri f. nagariensis]|eukprot:XP_002958091.1 Ca2+/H+ antiporter, cation antiporter, membrane protein [Volvox carteri f. nagariensis]